MYNHEHPEYSHISWFSKGYDSIWLPYTQMGNTCSPLIPVSSAEGCYFIDDNGNKFLDGICSWWSVCHGYQNPHIVNAISKQASKLAHVAFAGLAHEPAYRLASRLAEITPGNLNKIFFADSGSIGIEIAMKIAVQYFRNIGSHRNSQGENTKVNFVSFHNGYHGDTMACMSVSDSNGYQAHSYKGYFPAQFYFQIPNSEQEFLEFEEKINEIKDEVAAFIIEPLFQAASGMVLHSSDQLKRLCDIAKKNNILFIADEMAVGMGRLGNMFASNIANIIPDILIFAKALTGGTVSLAAVASTEEVFEAFRSDTLDKALMHGTTYMANPIACAAANASLDLFEKHDRIGQVLNIEKWLLNSKLLQLESLPTVKCVSIKGAMASVTLNDPIPWEKTVKIRNYVASKRIWLRPFFRFIYIMPAYIISEDEIDVLIDTIYHIVTVILNEEL